MNEKSNAPVCTPIGDTRANSPNVPWIYFDGTICSGSLRGEVQIELGACILRPSTPGQLETEIVTVGHLRCGRVAAMDLRQAIDNALKASELAITENAPASEPTPEALVIPLAYRN